MFAIVEVAGQQFKVEKDSKLFVHRLDEKEGNKIFLDKVLLIDNEGKVKIGTPLISNARVSATVLSHLKGDKVKVFKKKRRKGYQVLNGHRQYFTEIVINTIEEKVAAAKEKVTESAEKKATAATTSTVKKTAAAQKPKTTSAKPSKETEAKGGTKTKTTAKPATTKTTTVKTKPAGTKTTAGKEKKEVKAEKPGTKTTAKKKTKES
ncbi:MAG: 50S ribosomal protein L21 [Chlorobi bacterium]|nr:50S ribosomal protein L21 [Chlorobiota bacterium]